MSTTTRKARKRAGIPFTKAQKVATPLSERSFVTHPVLRRQGDALPYGQAGNVIGLGRRSRLRVLDFFASGGRTRGSHLSGAVAGE